MSTIRLLGSALVLCGSFVLESGPLAADTYHVSLSGDDKNDGKSPERAWRTVAYAATKATAGDTVFIKAGNYGREIVKCANSGSEKAPIVFQGYTNKPGDTPDPKYRPGDDLDARALPVLDGGDGTGNGVDFGKKQYVTIRNLGVTRYGMGLGGTGTRHIVLENLYVTNIGGLYNLGISFDLGSEHCAVRNCVLADCSGNNITLRRTHHSVVENCKTYGVKADPPEIAPDYYIVIADGHDNVVRDCLAENLHGAKSKLHPGHGIGIKDQVGGKGGNSYPDGHSYNNKIINCVSRNNGEYFFVGHGAYNNEFVNCTAVGQWRSQARWSEGINIRDGAHDNTFRNCRVEGTHTSVALQDTSEGPKNPDGSPLVQVCSKNALVNCVFSDSNVGIEVWNADNNLFKNCVFDNVQSALVRFPFDRKNQGNICRNTTVTNVRGRYQQADKGAGNAMSFTHSNFWANEFEMPAGAGNVAKDPLFADAAKKDFHLKSTEGRWNGSAWVTDAVSSPCIDAGDPSDKYEAEPQPNGGRINIGAYGNTTAASKSHSRVQSKQGSSD